MGEDITNKADAFITAEDVGAAIRVSRGEKTQKECAAQGGIDRAAWNQYEKGRAYPKPYNIERIAEGLGITVIDLAKAVIQEWLKRMDLEPLSRESEPGVYNFTMRGRIELEPTQGEKV